MSSSRVPAHGFIMGKSPDFPYLCVYKSICQRLAFACKSCIHRRFICGCKGLHVVFYTLEQKKRLASVHYVCYNIDCELFIRKSCVLRIDSLHPIYTILTHGSQLFLSSTHKTACKPFYSQIKTIHYRLESIAFLSASSSASSIVSPVPKDTFG